jgi:hypothetical protein
MPTEFTRLESSMSQTVTSASQSQWWPRRAGQIDIFQCFTDIFVVVVIFQCCSVRKKNSAVLLQIISFAVHPRSMPRVPFHISKQRSLAASASALSRRTAAKRLISMAMNRLRVYLEGLRRRQRERRMAIALNCDLLAAAAKMKDRRPLHEDDRSAKTLDWCCLTIVISLVLL